jgi:hypothetical protein
MERQQTGRPSKYLANQKRSKVMKRTIAVVALVLGMSLGFTSRSSAQGGTVIVTVPFDFAIEGRVLPQGTYHITSDTNFVTFKSGEQKTNFFTRGIRGDGSADGQTKLVFDDVKGSYFLRKIVTVSDNMNMDFPRSNLQTKTEHSRSIYAETSGR